MAVLDTITCVRGHNAYRNNNQGRHSRPWVVRVLLDEAGVDHKDNTIDCDRGLCNVRGQHNLPGTFWRRFKNLGLHIAWKVRVDRTNNQLGNLIAQRSSCFLQVFVSGFDLFLTLEAVGIHKRSVVVGVNLR